MVLFVQCIRRWLFFDTCLWPDSDGGLSWCAWMAVDLREQFFVRSGYHELTVTQIIEGLLTQVVAIGAWFLIVDFPDKAKGLLKGQDSAFIEQRIEQDRGDSVADPLTFAKFKMHLKDFKLWVFALMSVLFQVES